MVATKSDALVVTSHVGRDVLAQAAQFKTEAAVVWEYVVNSLQYVDPGTPPVVQVSVKKDLIQIADNGRGMNAEMLRHYFTMHGENVDRKSGRPGRGKWGTGKSAAFGIANQLEIDTVQNGERNVVRLTREAIDSSAGEAVPLEWLVKNESVDVPDGTVVTIGDLVVDRVDRASIVEYIERNLAAFRGVEPKVAVNSTLCEYHPPPIDRSFTFRPSPKQAEVLGDIELVIFSSTKPLRQWEQGVAITAGPGNLVAIETGGITQKDLGNYLWGEIDVPALESFDSPIEPFDPSRSLSLNPKHPVVAILLGFVGSKLEHVRRELVAREKEARDAEEARRLAQQADSLAEILNADFREQMSKLRDIRAATGRGPASALHGQLGDGDSEPDVWMAGLDQPGTVERIPRREGESESEGNPVPEIPVTGQPDAEGQDLVSPSGGEGKRKKPRGGFHVDYKNLGDQEDRWVYDPNQMMIIINLDHPAVAGALSKEGLESVTFKRLSYEIAFSAYAIALQTELVNRDPGMPADDVLYDVRETLRRITRAAAALY